MISSVLAIARYTVIEQIRNRLYLIILFFGGALLVSSLLLGALASGHEVRVVFDLGLVALELFGLASAVFGAVNLVLQEMETKTIYLILTRPVPRSYYIVGRFIGLTTAVILTMVAMAVLHVGVMLSDPQGFREFTIGWSFWAVYPTLVLMSICKMLMTTAVAIFFSLFATSSVSALVFTAFFWVTGHFGPELSFLIDQRAHGLTRTFVHVVATVFPNFQYLNFRDLYAIPNFPGYQFMGWAGLYVLGYSFFFLSLTTLLFSRKEF